MPRIERMPLFPLGLVLYPREGLPLHIFEPRYKEMAAWCLDTGNPFGIVFFDEGKLARVGCTAFIHEVIERYSDGRMDIIVTGQDRFRIDDIHDDLVYLTADVKTIEEPEALLQRDQQERVITQHMRLLELAGRTVRPSLYENVERLSYVIAPNAGLTPQQKQELLELLTESQRIDYLILHFESLIPRVEEMEEVRRKIRSNGHFKDFPPEIGDEEDADE